MVQPQPDPGRPEPRARGRWIAPAFGAIAWLRRGRAFHPRGEVWSGTWSGLGGALPSLTADLPALVRVSRGIGLPRSLPDVHGTAVRIVTHDDGEIDLLFATYAGRRWQIPWPRRAGSARPQSTIAVFRRGTSTVRLHATSDVSSGSVAVDLVHADGRSSPVGTMRLAERVAEPMAEVVRFDPTRCGPDLEPAGLYNRWRSPAYRASQTARAARARGSHRELPVVEALDLGTPDVATG